MATRSPLYGGRSNPVVAVACALLALVGCKGCDNTRVQTVDECTADALKGVQESCSSPGNTLLGECKAGVVPCVDGKKDRSQCIGEVLPQPEVCDGKDNDCNGAIDDNVTAAADPRVGPTCGQELVPADKIGIGPCKLGAMACKNGAVVCDGAVAPQPEVCDGVDNDCNHLIDDGSHLYEICQSPGNPLIGECRPGVYRCVNGRMDRDHCLGEVKPSPEICDGKDNDCTGQADEGCSVAIVCPADVTTPVGTPVTLTATATLQGGTITGYSWLVLAGPAGGVGTPNQWNPDPPTAATETFLPMITGVYTIRVIATGSNGATASCDMQVTAVGYGLHVELTWDGAADMDLHLHNGSSTPWFTTPGLNDCYYGNRTVDWDVIGSALDNPGLDIDNVVSYGPENIRMAVPVVGETYTVGVHDYGRGDGRIATIRIFCGTALTPQVTYVSRAFVGAGAGQCTTNEFWKVASVVFTSSSTCTITLLDTWSSSAARCASF